MVAHVSRALPLVSSFVRDAPPFEGSPPDDAPDDMMNVVAAVADSATDGSSGDKAGVGDEGGYDRPRSAHAVGAPARVVPRGISERPGTGESGRPVRASQAEVASEALFLARPSW